jgi:repressor LexA
MGIIMSHSEIWKEGNGVDIGKRIKERRKQLGLSADDVAAALGVDRSTVYRYESQEIEKFPLQIVEPIAKVLKVSPAYLMGWQEKPIKLRN